MAKLVAVCRDDEFHFDRRQIPLMIEETLTMVMEIPETVISAECVTSIDVSQFLKKYSCLSHGEMSSALMVGKKDLFTLLSMAVPCVGCRRSVERLYDQLWKSGQPALEPLTISASGVLTLSANFLEDAKLIYALFYIHGTHLNDVVDTIPKSKRNKRCILHSLETHKAARASGWMDVWDLLSQECRDEVVLIDSDSLLDTLETYLRKHRFCSECKSKVLKAYSILAGDTDGDSEKGYCATLYEGLKSCPKERHIHVVCDTDFIAHLIGRAEPELAGGRRERHARTIDIAQEEVLTCLGIHLWERLHRLWQKLRAEEQTWQILFYLGVEALRKRFETSVEEKQGISQLELVVEEISEAEKAKEQRRENKRLKRKKRKENKAKSVEDKSVPLEEKFENIENDEKCSEETISSIEIEKECFESADDCSEKSSCDSQVSPGKTDPQLASSSTTSPKLSPCSSSVESSYGLLKPAEDAVALSKEKSSICNDTDSSKCNIKSSSKSCPSENGHSLKPVKSCSTEDLSCKDCDSDSNSPWLEQNFRKGDSCRSTNQPSKYNGSRNNNTNNDCECDSGKPTGNKRNGFYTNHDNNRGHYKNGHKRNGYHECRSSPSVGPRFSRYESQNRWKNESESNHSNDHYHDVCAGDKDHGKGKRGGKGGNKYKDSYWNDQSSPVRESKRQVSHNGKNEEHTSQPPAVVDEDELRLLKMMGWNTAEDSLGLSEQEIQEFKANKSDVQSRRKELRDKLRDQFQKLCVISAN